MKFDKVKGQRQIVNKLIEMVDGNHFPHALLISGRDGYGNLALALALAQYISCTDKQRNTKEKTEGAQACELVADSCGTCPSCRKYTKLSHPDLHVFFPTVKTLRVKVNQSSAFLAEFREKIAENNGYMDLEDWYDCIGADAGKQAQGVINVKDSEEIVGILGMKSYESVYKVVVVWNVDKMNTAASNSILKILEEPFENTVFIFTTQNKDSILPTILSRVQVVNLPPLPPEIVAQELKNLHPEYSTERINKEVLLSEGDLLKIGDSNMRKIEEFAIKFVELNKKAIRYKTNFFELVKFVEELSKFNKEKLRSFLLYTSKTIERCWQYNEGMELIEHPLATMDDKFKRNYPKFITRNNLRGIFDVIEKALKNIDSNANVKINLTNMMINLGTMLDKR